MPEASIRPAAVAGTFYPADPARLHDQVDALLRTAAPPPAPAPRALIVPHAGYAYSGPVAATAYAHLAATRSSIGPILILGPAHYVLFDGLALSGATAFASPLGTIPAAVDLERRLRRQPEIRDLPEAHRPEHSIEVQFPFLQLAVPDLALAALAVGRTTPEAAARSILAALADPEGLVLVSSDLSHYHDAERARRLDAATADAIERLRPADLAPDAACGLTGVAGLLLAAAELELTPTRLDLRNSADTAGSPQRVVGYGVWSFA